MKIRQLIWDFDGTLYDTYGAIVAAFSTTLYEKFGVVVETDRIFQLVKVDTKYCAQEIASETGLDQKMLLGLARDAYINNSGIEQKPFEYVRNVCELVHSIGGENYLVTHRDRKSLDAMLLAYEFQSFFKEIISADDGYPPKPSPESFEYIIKKYDLPLNDTCGVGDRDLDVLAANSAGISSIYFCQSGGRHTEATLNLSSFKELWNLVDSV
jgi:HAD superfamily hydrolase (TIGR01549 family)